MLTNSYQVVNHMMTEYKFEKKELSPGLKLERIGFHLVFGERDFSIMAFYCGWPVSGRNAPMPDTKWKYS